MSKISAKNCKGGDKKIKKSKKRKFENGEIINQEMHVNKSKNIAVQIKDLDDSGHATKKKKNLNKLMVQEDCQTLEGLANGAEETAMEIKKRKRKHNGENHQELDDVIVFKMETAKEMKHKKHKDADLDPTKLSEPKKKKKSKKASETEDNDNESDGNANELHEPTLEELRQSVKPENIKDIKTKRSQKKLKQQQRLEVQKDLSVEKERKRNEAYLVKWKEERAAWKFEKLRQISIQQTMFDEEKLGSDIWPIALLYLAGAKGAAKDKLVRSAEEIVSQLDESNDDDNVKMTTKYRRARELLQLLN